MKAAQSRIKNPVLKNINAALLKCRQNILSVSPEEYATFPINREPGLTDNYCGTQQQWSKGLMLYQILNKRQAKRI